MAADGSGEVLRRPWATARTRRSGVLGGLPAFAAGVRLVISDAHKGLRSSIERSCSAPPGSGVGYIFMLGVLFRSTGTARASSLRSRTVISHGSISCWRRLGWTPPLPVAGLVAGTAGPGAGLKGAVLPDRAVPLRGRRPDPCSPIRQGETMDERHAASLAATRTRNRSRSRSSTRPELRSHSAPSKFTSRGVAEIIPILGDQARLRTMSR